MPHLDRNPFDISEKLPVLISHSIYVHPSTNYSCRLEGDEMHEENLTASTMVRQTGALIFLIGIACIPRYGQGIGLCILIVTACGNPAWTLRCLAAGTMVAFISSPLLSAGTDVNVLVSVLKWLLLFVACGRSFLSRAEPTKSYRRLLTYWAFVTAALLANSFFVSSFPVISVFKTISFSLGLLCVIRLSILTQKRNDEMLLFVAEMGVAVFSISAILLPLGAGYSRNARGFNGVLNHPQALGVFLVMTGAVTFAAAFKAPRLHHILIVLGLAQWSMIFLTGARTALVAISLGGIVYVCEVVVQGRKKSRISYLPLPFVAMTSIGLVLVVTLAPGIRESFGAFLVKGDEQSLDHPESALVDSSRAGQIYDALEVAEGHPLLGYGFGVDPDSQSNMDSNGAQLGGIPLSAPVEQGFLPLATVAQIGLVGSAFVLVFLFSIYQVARVDSGETSALFAAVLGVNLGEMIFYSVGGLGILMWLVLSLFAASGALTAPPLSVSDR
jgi:hypothetical protein